jgi:hypothetical protein
MLLQPGQAVPDNARVPVPTHLDPLAFVFGEEAAEMFRGKSVRVTPDKRVSVYDVIQIVCEVEQPRHNLNAIISSTPEVGDKITNFQFHGQGQKLTPVTNIQGMLELLEIIAEIKDALNPFAYK